MKMRVLHMADIHLGAEPDKGRPWGEGRGKQLWEAFALSLKEAERQGVDLVLIAGDLFHRQPLKRELKEVNGLFCELSHAQVVIMAGNHDYLSKNSAYRSFTWNKNVHFFQREQIEFIEISQLNVILYGLSYEHKEIPESLYLGLQKKKQGSIHILLAHGGDEKHIPLQMKELERSGFDYVALGHIHSPRQLKENRIIMAGALQPLDYNDPGPHGYWITDISKGDAMAAFYPIRGCEYVHDVVELDGMTTNHGLRASIRNKIAQSEPYQIYKIILVGRYDPELELDIEQLECLERVAAVEVRCRPDYDFEKLKQEYKNQIIGRYIAELEAMPQSRVVKKALYDGVDAFLLER